MPNCGNTVHSSVPLFTDEYILYKEIKIQNDHNKLQEDLESQEKKHNNWGMPFNTKKNVTYYTQNSKGKPSVLQSKQPCSRTNVLKPILGTPNTGGS